MASQEFKYPYLPGLLLGADPVNAGAAIAENVELPKLGELSKRPGFRRVNQRRYAGAIVCIPDLQRICDYRKLLVLVAFPELPGIPAPIFEHEQPLPDGGGGGGDDPEPFFAPNYAPIAVASADPEAPVMPTLLDTAPVQFSSAGSYDPDGSITSYLWDFGDGGTSEEANPLHSFGFGVFTVTLTVTDNEGDTASVTLTVTVTATDMWERLPDLPASASQSTLVVHNGDPFAHTTVMGGGIYRYNGTAWVAELGVPGTDSVQQLHTSGGAAYAHVLRDTGPFLDSRIYRRNDGTGVWALETSMGTDIVHAGARELFTYAGDVWFFFIQTSSKKFYKRNGGAWNLDAFHTTSIGQVALNRYSELWDGAFVAAGAYLRPSWTYRVINTDGASSRPQEFGTELWLAGGSSNNIVNRATFHQANWTVALTLPAPYNRNGAVWAANGYLWIAAGINPGPAAAVFRYDGVSLVLDRAFAGIPGDNFSIMGAGPTYLYLVNGQAVHRRLL